jgi:DNA-binding winged helix-turn-helix (wHTH) protein
MTTPGKRRFRFGVFEADEQAEELRKQGRTLALKGQPLQVLFMLLDRPGEAVTRTEIQQRLWPDGTTVDFDHSLNTAVNKVRDALGDSAASPRFVETLARRGYRFIAPVEITEAAPASEPVPPPFGTIAPGSSDQNVGAGNRSVLTGPDELPQASRPVVRSLFLLLQVMYLSFYLASLSRLTIAEDVLRRMIPHPFWAVTLLIITAVVGIPTRLYLLAGVAFKAPSLRENFLKLFPVIFPLDELWALAPFLLMRQIGLGLALGATAALLYVPFAQRSRILMGAGEPARDRKP